MAKNGVKRHKKSRGLLGPFALPGLYRLAWLADFFSSRLSFSPIAEPVPGYTDRCVRFYFSKWSWEHGYHFLSLILFEILYVFYFLSLLVTADYLNMTVFNKKALATLDTVHK